jgi:branched-chain amino acid transport system permease protein
VKAVLRANPVLRLVPWVVALAVIAVLPFSVSALWLYTLSIVCIYAIAAVGYNLLLGNTGQISLAPAAFVAIGAYSMVIGQDHGVPLLVCVGIAVVISAAVSILLGVVTLRLSGFYLALSTLALAELVQQLLGSQTELTGGYGGVSAPALVLFKSGYGTVVDNFWTTGLALVITVALTRNILRSYLGRAFAAVRDVAGAASTSGIRPRRYKLVAFVISGIYAAIAGCLYGSTVGFIDPSQFGLPMTVQLVGMIVIGGMGSITGSLLGAVFFVVLPQELQITATVQALGFGILIMATMVLLPGGVVSLGDRLRGWVSGVRSRRDDGGSVSGPPGDPSSRGGAEPVTVATAGGDS